MAEVIDKQQLLDWLDGYMAAAGKEANRDRSDLVKVYDYVKNMEPIKFYSVSRKYVEIDPGFWQDPNKNSPYPVQPIPNWYGPDTGTPLKPPYEVTCNSEGGIKIEKMPYKPGDRYVD